MYAHSLMLIPQSLEEVYRDSSNKKTSSVLTMDNNAKWVLSKEVKGLFLIPFTILTMLGGCDFFFLINFYWSVVALQCDVSFYCTAKVNQQYVHIHPLFFGFPSHLGHHRAASGVPWAVHRFSLASCSSEGCPCPSLLLSSTLPIKVLSLSQPMH